MKNFIRTIILIIAISLLYKFSILGAEISTKFHHEPGFENFTNQNIYTTGQFTDVDSSAWYATEVARAFEYGLMNGNSSNTFGVTGNVTIAEVITLASRIKNTFYTGEADFAPSDVWYRTYVDYALENSIITSEYSNYNASATRAQFAEILSCALPSYALEEINWIEDDVIPDVKVNDTYGETVYSLYRAGIITGSDENGTFNPNSTILRTEVSAIVTRMVDESSRKSFTLVGEY